MPAEQPDIQTHRAKSKEDVRAKELITAQLIGLIALGLALVVPAFDGWGGNTCQRASISHYYYDPRAGIFFVAALSFVAAFLLRYEGEAMLDGKIANLGAVAAFGLVLFPTEGPGCLVAGAVVDFRPEVFVTGIGTITESGLYPLTLAGEVEARFSSRPYALLHSAAAGGVFLTLLYFTAYAFIRTNSTGDLRDGRWTPIKRFRNLLYALCALAMLGGLVLIVLPWFVSETQLLAYLDAYPFLARPVYWGEALFLAAFGTAWMIKSRFWLSWLEPLFAMRRGG